jgi:hypothetical protein
MAPLICAYTFEVLVAGGYCQITNNLDILQMVEVKAVSLSELGTKSQRPSQNSISMSPTREALRHGGPYVQAT